MEKQTIGVPRPQPGWGRARKELAAESEGRASPMTGAPIAGFQRWWLLIALTLVNTLSYTDRQILGLVIGPIIKQFRISDAQASYLVGFSFVILFAICAPLVGYIADRFNRRGTVTGAVFVWSAAQTLGGAARSYGQLFASRLGLGLGESVLTPTAFSVIRDAFPQKQRGLAFSVFALGPTCGTGVALLLAGTLLSAASNGAFAGVPLLGSLRPWQVVLMVPGLIGIVLVLVLQTARFPARTHQRAASVGYREAVRFWRANWRLYLPLWAAFTLFSLAVGGTNAWQAEAIARAWGVPRPTIGYVLGPAIIASSFLGLLLFGSLINRLAKRWPHHASGMVAIGSTAIAALCMILAVSLQEYRTLAAVLFVLQNFFFVIFNPGCSTIQADVTPTEVIGKLTAFYYMISSLLGLGAGPSVVVLCSKLFSGDLALAHGMALSETIGIVAGITCLLLALRQVRSVKAGEFAPA